MDCFWTDILDIPERYANPDLRSDGRVDVRAVCLYQRGGGGCGDFCCLGILDIQVLFVSLHFVFLIF